MVLTSAWDAAVLSNFSDRFRDDASKAVGLFLFVAAGWSDNGLSTATTRTFCCGVVPAASLLCRDKPVVPSDGGDNVCSCCSLTGEMVACSFALRGVTNDNSRGAI